MLRETGKAQYLYSKNGIDRARVTSIRPADACGLEQEGTWRWGQWPQAGHGDHKRAPSAGAGTCVQERWRRCMPDELITSG